MCACVPSMGCGSSRGARPDHHERAPAAARGGAQDQAAAAAPPEPRTAADPNVNAAYGCTGCCDAEEAARFEEAGLYTVASLLTKRFFGYRRKDFAGQCVALPQAEAPRPRPPAAPAAQGAPAARASGARKQGRGRVLVVIDMQDGYDGGFVASLPDDTPGSLGWIQAYHPVATSYAMQSGEVIERFAAGARMLRLDKVWNRGVDAAAFASCAGRVVAEVRDGDYDCVVFTSDYLERRDGDEKGVFALDTTPWSDPNKPVAKVPFEDYLTFAAGGPGTDISHRIRGAIPAVTNRAGPRGAACGKPVLYFRKQVDDAFDDGTETSSRTGGEAWLDDVGVSDSGLPSPEAETLLTLLTARGYPAATTDLAFCGVVTDRCVASSLLHAAAHGYRCTLLQGGCCAVSDAKQEKGLALIREKGGALVDIVP